RHGERTKAAIAEQQKFSALLKMLRAKPTWTPSADKEIEFERGFAILLSLRWEREKAIGDKVARFRQVNTDKTHVHHDALEFPNGEIVLVTRLYEGQHATVLQLPALPHSVNGAEEVRHAAVVG